MMPYKEGMIPMRKRGFYKLAVSMLALMLFFVAAALTAGADVVWSPSDNFFADHYADCVHVGRSYLANGPEGYITIYESPRSSKIVDQFENGNQFYVSFTYTRGKSDEWGVVQFRREDGKAVTSYMNDDGTKTGWIPMKDLLVCYDNYSFVEEHEDEFEEYEGGFDAHAYEDKIRFWTYPGSGVISSSVDMSDWEGEQMSFSYIYTDEADRQWGYVGYFFAHRGWVCLSDPTSESLPSNEVVYKDLIPAAKPNKPVASGDLTLVIILVVGVVVLTAVLIAVIFRKKRH